MKGRKKGQMTEPTSNTLFSAAASKNLASECLIQVLLILLIALFRFHSCVLFWKQQGYSSICYLDKSVSVFYPQDVL
jgi:hypothetical protein